MSGPPLNPIYYPFASVPSTSNSNVFPYDIVVDTVYPGLIFDAQEAGAAYSVIREVEGCLWFVLNADFDETTLQWTQEDPTNPNTSAYAMELCAAGTWNWYSGAPTLIPGTPVTWRQVFLIDANGSVISTPQTVTTSINGSEQLLVTWNAGSLTQVTARFMNVTDTSSAANSILDNMAVNGVSKWQVDKTGTLQVGIIPAARITGLTPFPGFNNVTLTGTTTVSGPADFNGPVVMNDGLTVTAGATILEGTLTSTIGSTLEGGTTVTGGEAVTGGLTTDSLGVTGTATVGALHATGTSDLNGTVTAGAGLSVAGTSNLHNVVLAAGDSITVNGTTPTTTLESTDGTISVTQVSPTEYNIGVSTTHPPSGATYAVATNFAVGSTTGSLTLGPLPGTGSDTYIVICSGSLQFQNASKLLTLTGSGAGVTWPNSPQGYQNANAGCFPFTFYGTAVGGTSPSVTWTCNDMLGFEPMTMVIAAYNS